jgi:hypothetical protein
MHQADHLADFISSNAHFSAAWTAREIPSVQHGYVPFHPAMGPRSWNVRPLDTVGDVSAWLELDDGALSWLADRKGLERGAAAEPLRHYRRTWVARGARLPRLLEAPKPRLKAIQRRILAEVLNPIRVHDAAHGFVPGRSVLTHAALHAGKALVVRFDLEAFFTNVATWRALSVFRAAGYPREVAAVLLGLCTTRTPEPVLREAPWPETPALAPQRFFLQRRLADWHLPQGAPTSPALANLGAWELDLRLAAFATRRGLVYSRYADDLVFSGERGVGVGALTGFVSGVARDEGFRINASKTRVMRAHEQQRVTGVVVNVKPNVARADFDVLKAVLHRCRCDGVRSEAPGSLADFRATLQGRISWVRHLSRARGDKLQRAFDALAW